MFRPQLQLQLSGLRYYGMCASLQCVILSISYKMTATTFLIFLSLKMGTTEICQQSQQKWNVNCLLQVALLVNGHIVPERDLSIATVKCPRSAI